MPAAPDAIMIFAAGFGTRMRPLTEKIPKPLVRVLGRTLIDRALDLADDAGISRKVVNLHCMSGQIRRHLAQRNDIEFSEEQPKPLETGGGLKAALPLLQSNPVFTMNPDSVWTGANPLKALALGWNPDSMDALLMLVRAESARGHAGRGDFDLDSRGKIHLPSRGGGASASHVYSGAQIMKTNCLERISGEVFSLAEVWRELAAADRLHGLVHEHEWVDVGTPEGVKEAEKTLLAAERPHQLEP